MALMDLLAQYSEVLNRKLSLSLASAGIVWKYLSMILHDTL